MAALYRHANIATVALALCLVGYTGHALDRMEFSVTGGDRAMTRDLRAASGLLAAEKDGRTAALDLFTDARAEYGRLLAALYAKGRYGPEIHVLIDGREAADIAPLDAPAAIGEIIVTVDLGPSFTFSRAVVAPLPAHTELPEGFVVGQLAGSEVIKEVVQTAIEGWRNQGHAKAGVGRQVLVADHDTSTLSAAFEMVPGPRLRFGPLAIRGTERLGLRRAVAIAGLPAGAQFDPRQVDRAAERLRRSGVFSSVTMSEDEVITAPDLLGISADLVEARLRRYAFGAEVASDDGVVLSGGWLHRNLFGGAERLEITGEIAGIATLSGGADYRLGITLDRPATPGPDTVLNLGLALAQINDADWTSEIVDISAGFTRYFGNTLIAHAALNHSMQTGRDAAGNFAHRTLELPIGLTWDRRDSKAEPTRLFYIDVGAKPFFGLGHTDNGARLSFDVRGYHSLGPDSRMVLAARLQGGAVLGADILDTPRDDLFFSGGGGTVRGQAYQSLGVTVDDAGTAVTMGGNRFLAGSLEARVRVSARLGVVGFFDTGLVGNGKASARQSGAGVGARFATGVGPIRLDLAVPVQGGGRGVQLYVGLGHAF